MEQMETQPTESKVHLRGFGSMKLTDPARFAAITRSGGVAAHAKGTAHQFTPEEASAAGRKGAASRLRRKLSEAATLKGSA